MLLTDPSDFFKMKCSEGLVDELLLFYKLSQVQDELLLFYKLSQVQLIPFFFKYIMTTRDCVCMTIYNFLYI